MWHKIEHWLGWNAGKVITKWDSKGNLWVAFQCSSCGKISSPAMTGTKKRQEHET